MENRFLGLIEASFKKNWDLPAFTDINGSTYYYRDAARVIEKIHILLEQAGIQKGDKISIVGRNSSNWVMCFFGILSYGAVAVPILHEFKPDNIHHLVNHSDSKVLLVAQSNWDNLDEEHMPGLDLIILLDNLKVIKSTKKEIFDVREHIDDYFSQKFPVGLQPSDLHYHLEQPEELALINYTSGTMSNSKGVMIPYRSLWSNTQMAYDRLLYIHPGDSIVCMLPMAHMYGLAFEILNFVNKGCHIYFLTRQPVPKVIGEAFQLVHPVLVLCVPLIVEKIIRNKVFPELQKPLTHSLMYIPFLKQKILGRIKEKLEDSFGGNFGEIVIGGAPMNREVEDFLHNMHFRYTIGYGMTECGPLVAYTPWDKYKEGSVGRVADRMEVKIDSDDPQNKVGEILVRGMNVMLGYYKNPVATAAVMQPDGWMRTGDLGTIDKDGFIYIRGRSKNLILGANGQNIYPEELEDRLNNMPYVSESLVVPQDGKIVALIYPNLAALDRDGIGKERLNPIMQQNIEQLNQQIPSYAKVSSFKINQEEFEKTPKHSIKRYIYSSGD